jgi:hypothetical protein
LSGHTFFGLLVKVGSREEDQSESGGLFLNWQGFIFSKKIKVAMKPATFDFLV